MRRRTAHNNTHKKLAVQWLNEELCFISNSVVADSFRLQNRQLLIAANRWHALNKMTRTIIVILSFFLLTAAHSFQQADSFEVSISFIGLPSPIKTNYLVKDNQIKVFEEFYNPNYDSTSFRNVHIYRDIDHSMLINFLRRVNWDTIPKELITPTIDGYQFDVDIKLEGKEYHFNIDNTYHPTFDSLLTICNQMLPKEKVRNEYKIYYLK